MRTSATPPTAGSPPRTWTPSWSRGRASSGQPAFYRQIADYDLELLDENERQLPELALPVRVLWGTEDAWIPLETGRRLAGLVPGAVLTEVPEAGHLMQYDAPVALATALSDWLDADGMMAPWPTRAQDSPPTRRTWWTCRTW